MRTLLMTFFMAIFAIWLSSCQINSLKIIFESSQKDSATKLNETKIYKLRKKAVNADFNYSKLNNIDDNTKDTLSIKNLMPVFEPIAGHFTYYQFISTFKGHSFQEVDKDFHDILIIKTDDDNKIIDAYQYTLEWAEPPLQFDLYKTTARNLVLRNDLDISTLKLSRAGYSDDKDRGYKEAGRIKLE